MRRFRDASLRTKLTALAMLTSFVVLLLTTIVFVVSEVRGSYQSLVSNASTLAEVVGANTTAAIVFADQAGAEKTLSALSAVSQVLAATVYTKDGKVFARFRSPTFQKQAHGEFTANESIPPSTAVEDKEHIRFFHDHLELTRPIVLDGEELGRITLHTNVREVSQRLWRNARYVVGIVLFGALVVSYLLSSFLQRAISLPILRLAETTNRVSREKNYAVRVEKYSNDELGTFIGGFNEMLAQLQTRDEQLRQHRNQLEEQVTAVRKGTYTLSSSLQQISASLTQMTTSTAETATTVGQTATTVEEVKQSAYVANQKAQEISATSLRTAQVSKVGEQAVEDTIHEMNGVREQMETIAHSVVKLGEQSRTIGNIMTTISDLTEQSNLLAINAAIEAAKAGEAGKGFAVVAQEVRLLAEQSKQATVQVRAMLNDIQQAAQVAIMVTERGTKAVESGVDQSLRAGESIRALSQCITEAVQAMTHIAASSQQQLSGMDQVATAITTIKDASHRNAEGIRQLESSARSLQETGKALTLLL